MPWASCQIRKILGCACAGNVGNVFPPPLNSDLDMHHGTCVTHVPWCMPGSLTGGFLWSQWRGKRSRHSRRMRSPHFYVSGKRPINRLPNGQLVVKGFQMQIQTTQVKIYCLDNIYTVFPDAYASRSFVNKTVFVWRHRNLIGLEVNTLKPSQMAAILQKTYSNASPYVWILIEISIKFVPKDPIHNNPALVEIMVKRRSGGNPLSEPMMVASPTHICVTRPQWVKVTKVFARSWNILILFD